MSNNKTPLKSKSRRIIKPESFFQKIKKWTLPSKFTLVGVVGMVLIFIYQECSHYFENKQNKLADFNKSLEDAKKGVILETTKVNLDHITINVGGNFIYPTKRELIEGVNIGNYIPMGKVKPFEVKFNDGKVVLNSKFYNFNNEIVGEIENNEWHLNSNYYKRNYDEHAIEVIDNFDVVVMQIIFEKNNIYVNGILQCDNHMLICNGGSIAVLSGRLTGEDIKSIYIREGKKLKRIFEYTGKDWLGKRKII